MSNMKNKSVDRLFEVILGLKDVDECYSFFEDICTIKELQDLSQRLDTAIALSEGKNYQTICSEIGVSTATIGRVSRCLNYGAGGYKTAIKRLKEKTDDTKD